MSERITSLLPWIMQSERVMAFGLTEADVHLRMEVFVRQFKNTCLYEPEANMYKGQITLIRGRQHKTEAKVPGDYGLSKVHL